MWRLSSLALLLACSGGGSEPEETPSGSDDTGPGSEEDTGEPGSTKDCSGGTGLTGPSDHFLTARGESFWLLIPAELPPCAPLLLMGHGGGSAGGYEDGRWIDFLGTGFDAEAGRRGFVLMVPFLEDATNVEHGWSLDQTGVLDAMVEETAEQVDIDRTKVIFVGQSAGGHMAVYQGLYAPGVITHIGAISAGIGAYFDYPEAEPDPKLPFFVAHDPEDEVVPFRYSERLVEDLEEHGHEVEFLSTELGPGGHAWSPLLSESILDWWLGPVAGEG